MKHVTLPIAVMTAMVTSGNIAAAQDDMDKCVELAEDAETAVKDRQAALDEFVAQLGALTEVPMDNSGAFGQAFVTHLDATLIYIERGNAAVEALVKSSDCVLNYMVNNQAD